MKVKLTPSQYVAFILLATFLVGGLFFVLSLIRQNSQPNLSPSILQLEVIETITPPMYVPLNRDLNGDGVVDERDEALQTHY